MAVAVIQEFPIEGDDRSTTNYDRVQEALGTGQNPPAGGLMHSAGLDEQAESSGSLMYGNREKRGNRFSTTA
jgi:hypothetical protein